MKACIDVDYREDHAIAACLLFADWHDAAPIEEVVARIENVEPYIPGQFYRRELPCILAVLNQVNVALEAVVIDGYVWLDGVHKPGLGAHLYQSLNQKIPVIGVAKKLFQGAVANEVKRGSAEHPLYVTSVGIASEDAATAITRMHGNYRVPTLLKRVDQLCRQTVIL